MPNLRYTASLVYALLIALGVFSNVNADQGKAYSSKRSSDGTVVSLERRGGVVLLKYELRDSSKSGASSTQSIKLDADFVNAPFFSSRFIDLDRDGIWEVEFTGLCGNKVCEKIIYKLDSNEKKYSKFFEGSYSRVEIFDGYLVESGGSGCCAFEHHLYKSKPGTFAISGPPAIVVEVNAPDESSSLPAQCSFSDSDGKTIALPDKRLLKLCQVYGPGFKLLQ